MQTPATWYLDIGNGVWVWSAKSMWPRVCSMLASGFGKGMSTVSKPLVVFVLGGPGAGKGTQCTRIVTVSNLD